MGYVLQPNYFPAFPHVVMQEILSILPHAVLTGHISCSCVWPISERPHVHLFRQDTIISSPSLSQRWALCISIPNHLPKSTFRTPYQAFDSLASCPEAKSLAEEITISRLADAHARHTSITPIKAVRVRHGDPAGDFMLGLKSCRVMRCDSMRRCRGVV
jgi:hypothetical protein